MIKNMGSADRVIRILIGIVILSMYLTGQISGVVATVLGVAALVFVATSFLGSCPIYVPLGIDTSGKSKEE